MHRCPECDQPCNCLDGETDVENCAHIMTRDCTAGENDGGED